VEDAGAAMGTKDRHAGSADKGAAHQLSVSGR
jgi:hypothetical protein